MRNAGQRACAAVTDIGCRAGNGPGSGETAEQWRDQVGHPLTDQLLIGIVLGTCHAIGHHRGQQRFDCSKHGDSERRTNQIDDARQRDFRQAQRWQTLRYAPKCTANRGNPLKVKG
ncbi:hypothetical protein D3C80_1408320 [compost metagenome]